METTNNKSRVLQKSVSRRLVHQRSGITVITDDGNYMLDHGKDVIKIEILGGPSEYQPQRSWLQSWAIALLVFVRVLPKDEENWNVIQIGLRVAQWLALLPDLGAAFHSIFSFTGLSHCCGKPLLNLGNNDINWCKVFERMTWAYCFLILLEIYPVVQRGLPFNLVNPPLGFFLTIVLFFDDGKYDALIMWFIEVLSVVFEIVVWRLKLAQRVEIEQELSVLDQLVCRPQNADEEPRAYAEYIQGVAIVRHNLQYKKGEIDRVVRALRHGVALNSFLVVLILMFIIVIASSGGLCINSDLHLNPFIQNQLARCPACSNPFEFCEVCTETNEQCYFPYK
jgi:hypothetical protein